MVGVQPSSRPDVCQGPKYFTLPFYVTFMISHFIIRALRVHSTWVQPRFSSLRRSLTRSLDLVGGSLIMRIIPDDVDYDDTARGEVTRSLDLVEEFLPSKA